MAETPHPASRSAVLVMGAILTLLGVVFLLDKFFSFLSIDRLWPVFMLIPAVLLALSWAQKGREAAGLIVPITILVFYAAYFLWLNYTSWGWSGVTWPNYLIGPGLGFALLYVIERRTELLIPAFVLLGLAAVFYGAFFQNTWAVGTLLVVAGLALIVPAGFSRARKKELDERRLSE